MINQWKRLGTTQKIHIQLWFCFACILCLMLTVTWYARQQTIPPGVVISEWDAGSIPLEQFYATFSGSIDALERLKVTIHTPSASHPLETTLGELGLTTNADEIRAAIGGLTEGSILKRANTRWFMRGKAYRITLMLDEERLERTVSQHWNELQNAMPVDAKRTIDEHDIVHLEPDVPAYRIDTVELLSQLDRLMYTQFYAWIDKKLLDSSESIYVELPLRVLPPEVTIQELEEEKVKGKIMEFTTKLSSGGSEGRRHNIDSTSRVLSDQLLAPGEVFDYSKVIEKTREEIGYQKAPVILDGKLVPGIGGGICQVSTTLYNAVLRAGLDIVERRNHSLPISYAPLGQDATYSTGYINFRFRNTLDSHLLIRAELKGNQMIIKLFGEMEPGTKYTIESKIVEELAPPVKYVHNPSLAEGVEQTVSKGKTGYVVDTFRTKWVNGEKQETEKISRDRYQPEPRVVAKNEKPEKTNPTKERKPILEDGVFGPVYD